MAMQTPESPAAARPDVRYAGFWIRVLAALIDTVFLTALIIPPLLLIFGPRYFSRTDLSLHPADVFLNWVLPFALWMAFWLRKSATPGKMVLGLKIVDAATFGKPTAGRFVLRYLGYFVSTLPLGIGLIWAGWDDRKRGWHDFIAGTVVIRGEPGGP